VRVRFGHNCEPAARPSRPATSARSSALSDAGEGNRVVELLWTCATGSDEFPTGARTTMADDPDQVQQRRRRHRPSQLSKHAGVDRQGSCPDLSVRPDDLR
jgi:hypothetical protein